MFDPGSPLRIFIFSTPQAPGVPAGIRGGEYFASGLSVKIKLSQSEKGRLGKTRWFDNGTHCTLHSFSEMCGLFRTKALFLCGWSRPQLSGILFLKNKKESPIDCYSGCSEFFAKQHRMPICFRAPIPSLYENRRSGWVPRPSLT